MSYETDAVTLGIIGNEKRIAKILRVMAGTSEGSSFATIRKMVVGEAAAEDQADRSRDQKCRIRSIQALQKKMIRRWTGNE